MSSDANHSDSGGSDYDEASSASNTTTSTSTRARKRPQPRAKPTPRKRHAGGSSKATLSTLRKDTLQRQAMQPTSSTASNASNASSALSKDDEEETDLMPTADWPIEKLRKREEELQVMIDALLEDVRVLKGVAVDDGVEKRDGERDGEEKGIDDEDIDYSNFDAPEWCVPIKTNVMTFEWPLLAAACQFDVILMDPPWQLASHAPTRGVAIAYQQLPDACIEDLPISTLQQNGFIFIWVINNKYVKAFELMERWGYTYVDDITWVKQTVNRRMAKGHGYYLQHAKETCLIGRKGADPPGCRHGVASDVIFSQRRGQSQKPEELYEMIEELVPNGKYLEIFGRKNNLRDFWVTVGNEL
ncbi:MT-A70-domain-containing protein [Fimicolochytrium jonesii]|uniref:MT-A70-domain-containing protein n=1 Tax=Fimicolochytrium jonesii TaxID=1396493 RepID=UPI0022FDC54F|nr:MT-A70-domain-containing protein [Fimicolochytrium jonesii]KAI8817346.1 MT-A70-domain-containing protein [Fimicolochytrium jonesii]